MSLSAQEKVRVVTKLDELGIHFIEAGFPGSNPKELELFEMLAEIELQQADGLRLRDDPPARHRARPRTRPCACSPTGFAPVVTLVGKTWGLHLEKVTKVSREENLAMIARLGRLPDAGGQARDLRRRALLRRLPRRRRLRAGVPAGGGRRRRRERHALRHQRLEPAGPGRGGDRGDGRCAARGGGRDPHPQRPGVRGRQLPGRGRGGREPGAGNDERHRRAHRQRQPDLDPAGLQLKMGYELRRGPSSSHA